MRMNAVLSNPKHPEYGQFTVPLPIPHNQYNRIMEALNPKYKMLSDYDKRNAFDIEKYRSHKLVVKPTQTFDLYDMGEVEAD